MSNQTIYPFFLQLSKSDKCGYAAFLCCGKPFLPCTFGDAHITKMEELAHLFLHRIAYSQIRMCVEDFSQICCLRFPECIVILQQCPTCPFDLGILASFLSGLFLYLFTFFSMKLRQRFPQGIGFLLVRSRLREADNAQDILAKLCLHMIAVIHNHRMWKMFCDQDVVGRIHVHGNGHDI